MIDDEEESLVSVGWKVEVTSRKEREEALRDEAHQFEVKLRKFTSSLEQGIEVTMWQLNRNSDFTAQIKDDFTLKGTQIQLKLQRRGEYLVQGALSFNTKGGYLSKAINRRRGVDKAALDPLSLTEILEVVAGCDGYDATNLPFSSKRSKRSNENKSSSLFITLKASPTPVASSRSYFLKFKSRSARNDLLLGLRSLMAEMQVNEGVNISAIQNPAMIGEGVSGSPMRRRPGQDDGKQDGLENQPNENMLVPFHEVLKSIDLERHAYDRLLLIMLQGSSDLRKSEDNLVTMRGKLDSVITESKEKDRVQANDSKLIMQLSKKLETLLMDNEDLRDQNDTLNNRILMMESEKLKQFGTNSFFKP